MIHEESEKEKRATVGARDRVRKQEHAVDLRAGECAFIRLFTEPYASVDLHKKTGLGLMALKESQKTVRTQLTALFLSVCVL